MVFDSPRTGMLAVGHLAHRSPRDESGVEAQTPRPPSSALNSCAGEAQLRAERGGTVQLEGQNGWEGKGGG